MAMMASIMAFAGRDTQHSALPSARPPPRPRPLPCHRPLTSQCRHKRRPGQQQSERLPSTRGGGALAPTGMTCSQRPCVSLLPRWRWPLLMVCCRCWCCWSVLPMSPPR